MCAKFYLTTAIDYVNAKPHLGHAYEKVAADCIVRARRAMGEDALFVIGADEHSTNVGKAAAEAGLSPQEYTDRMEKEFRDVYARLNVAYDDFIRTSQPRHHAAVNEIVRRVRENGWITTDQYTGWYCDGCEAYYPEKDLTDGQCPNHGTKPRWVEEDNYFFKLSEFGDRLLEHYRAHPSFIRPSARLNEIVAFVEGGLNDLSISRAKRGWGIPFPDDHEHVVYVWFDALTNYISAVGFGTDDEKFAKWWPADVHIVGKDITRFHCVIWPAMLMAAGVELPESVFGHGFIYQRGTKMSKSLGNIVNPVDVVEVTGADALRYFLLREIIFGSDGDFTWDAFIARYNSALANDLGNLVKRTTDMTSKFLAGEIPTGAGAGDRTGLAGVAAEVCERAVAAYRDFDLAGALTAVWDLVRRANQAVEETKPWVLAKDEARRDELADVLAELLEAVRIVAQLSQPAIPDRSRAIRDRLGRSGESSEWATALRWNAAAGWKVAPGDPVFPRIDRVADDADPTDGGAASRKGPGKSAAPSRG
jgi:methionyl-tRNA synthetase